MYVVVVVYFTLLHSLAIEESTNDKQTCARPLKFEGHRHAFVYAINKTNKTCWRSELAACGFIIALGGVCCLEVT